MIIRHLVNLKVATGENNRAVHTLSPKPPIVDKAYSVFLFINYVWLLPSNRGMVSLKKSSELSGSSAYRKTDGNNVTKIAILSVI